MGEAKGLMLENWRVAIREVQEMKMQPSLERTLRHQELLKVERTIKRSCDSASSQFDTVGSPAT